MTLDAWLASKTSLTFPLRAMCPLPTLWMLIAFVVYIRASLTT